MQKLLPLMIVSAILIGCSSTPIPSYQTTGYTAISIAPDKYKATREGISQYYILVTEDCPSNGEPAMAVTLLGYDIHPEEINPNTEEGLLEFDNGKTCTLIEVVSN